MLKICIELDATYVPAHLILYRLHSGRQAARILTNAIKVIPDSLDLRLAFGEWLLNNGNKTFPPSHTIFHNFHVFFFPSFYFILFHPFYLHTMYKRTCTCCNAYISTNIGTKCIKQACNYWHLQVNATNGSMVAIAFANVEVGNFA